MQKIYNFIRFSFLFISIIGFFCACTSPKVEEEVNVLSDTLFGIPLTYDARPANLSNTQKIMTSFMTAYLQKDREGLMKTLSTDFKWHLHTGETSPNGQTKIGVDGMLEELERRAIEWSEVSYSNIQIYCTASIITQTFHIKGEDAINGTFDANGVDIYTITDGKLLSKDSYWKHIKFSNKNR